MAKTKTAEPRNTKAKAPQCSTCNGTGYVCVGCGYADGDCTCEDGPDLESCEECGE